MKAVLPKHSAGRAHPLRPLKSITPDSLLAMSLTGEYITNHKEQHCSDLIEVLESCRSYSQR